MAYPVFESLAGELMADCPGGINRGAGPDRCVSGYKHAVFTGVTPLEDFLNEDQGVYRSRQRLHAGTQVCQSVSLNQSLKWLSESGLLIWKPWAVSQPSLLSISQAIPVSTPSATTR